MKSIYELEPEGDQQRNAKKSVGPEAAERCVAQVARDVEADVSKAPYQRHEDNDPAYPTGHLLFSVKERCAGMRRVDGGRQISHWGSSEFELGLLPAHAGKQKPDSATDTPV